MTRASWTILLGLLMVASTGCLALPLALSTGLGAVGVYQRYEDRGVQRDQNEEIRHLREEIRQLRETLIRLLGTTTREKPP